MGYGLVLSRKQQESVIIGHDIKVTVIEIRGDKVRLGIIAPKDVSVHRQEVYDLIQASEEPSDERGSETATRPSLPR